MSATDRREDELLDLLSDLKRLAHQIVGDPNAVEAPSMALRGFDHAELGMLRLSSWLYGLHREAVKDVLDFLVESLLGDRRGTFDTYIRTVESLRTYFQHHLTSSPRDSRIKSSAEGWLAPHGGDFNPDSTAQWSDALDRLAQEAADNLQAVINGAEGVRDAAIMEVLADQWAARKARVVPAHEVDKLVELHAAQLGLDELNVKAFREQHNGGWQRLLRVSTVRTNARELLAGLIERELLNFQEVAPLPVSGDDVMDAFGIGPGREVGAILKTIATLHAQQPDNKEALLHQAAALHGRPLFLPD